MQISGVLPDVSVFVPSIGGCRLQDVIVVGNKCFVSPGIPRKWSYYCSNTKLESGPEKLRTRSPNFTVRACGGDFIPLAPLHLESPIGQLLCQILKKHPHLLLATANQQIENIRTQMEGQDESRRKALEEIIYCLIVQRFVDNEISMIPKISTTSSDLRPLNNQERKLESVHSPEALGMILSHLSLVLPDVRPLDSVTRMSKVALAKLYAASVMYAYFVRRVDQRYQLETSMNTLSEGFGEDSHLIFGEEKLSSKLTTYIMYLDAETRRRYVTIRSKEAISLIGKQTQALFGRPNVTVTEDATLLNASNVDDEVVSLTLSGLRLLVLEAVAFGSFLWDAELYVESKYPFISS
ncbi:hypothetical protein BUALT_Bualt02G0136700 [Buddleja alternifolia]|uniref:UV-B-induced protein n=1 Tax=Buddleja alternifolia TaxID=168488 RepID=A0AAV6Y6Q6_9LAMI|nr:hypothetical protein BUALT_Bualt02G0136700 [Buddleja alternifolia]